MENKKHWFTNGSIDKMCYECPDGFWPGRIVSDSWRKNQSKASSKCHWYNNGIEETFTQNCPDGYIPGRLEFSESFHNNQSKAQKDRWENMSDEDYKKECLARADGINNMSPEVRAKKSKNLSIKKKLWWKTATDTDIKNVVEKRKETISEWSIERKDEFHNKRSNSTKEAHYKGLLNTDTAKEKSYNTKKKNGTFNSSSWEVILYNDLCDKYGIDDVIWSYRDEKFPWQCDFYIKSESLYIDLRGHYTHGPHKFDPLNENDIRLLEEIRSKQNYLKSGKKNSYFTIEDVWTKLDPLKDSVAQINNLNYKVIYNSEFRYYLKERKFNNA